MLADNARPRSSEMVLDELQCLPPAFPLPPAGDNTCRIFVDRGLTLRGAFSGCDHLAVAGYVESNLALRVLDIREPGSFKGSATVEEARIAGRYEGALVVAKTLVVESAAYISGPVQCGTLKLEDGGKIDGALRILSEEAANAAQRENDAAPHAILLEASPVPEAEADEDAIEGGDAPGTPVPVDAMLVAATRVKDEALVAKAEATFREALKAKPFDVAALSGLGHLARQRGDLAGALGFFRLIMAADAENMSVRRVSIEILSALSRHDEAALLAKEVSARETKHSSARDDDASDKIAALTVFDEAEAMFKSVLDRHPKNFGALAGLGHLARRRGDDVGMLKYYTAALALEPMNIALRVEVARALQQQGEDALARQILEIVLGEHQGPQAGC